LKPSPSSPFAPSQLSLLSAFADFLTDPHTQTTQKERHMKETVTQSRFLDVFRQVRPNQFSRAALVALFEHLEELERDLGEETELDVIAICCDWTEYKDAIEAAEAYSWEAPEIPEDEERDDTSDRKALEYLTDQTHVVEFEGGILVLNF
jgi:hypothetical protein